MKRGVPPDGIDKENQAKKRKMNDPNLNETVNEIPRHSLLKTATSQIWNFINRYTMPLWQTKPKIATGSLLTQESNINAEVLIAPSSPTETAESLTNPTVQETASSLNLNSDRSQSSPKPNELLAILDSLTIPVVQTQANKEAALLIAVKEGDLDTLSNLIKQGANVNAIGEKNITPLILAAQKGDIKATQLLLDASANIDLYDNNHNTALMFAAQHGHDKIIDVLLKAGAKINAINQIGDTAFILAAKEGNIPVMRTLIRNGAFMPDCEVDYKPLDWRDRPSEINSAILSAWSALNNDSQSNWGCFNGRDAYESCGIKQHELVKSIIKNNPEKKEFYVLDIGAGNFQFGNALAEFLNSASDLPKDVKVNIISIRGESNLNPEVKELGICKVFELGAFKIENLIEEFTARDFDLNKKLDLIVSNWCFRHLVDPVGTFLQAYSLLRPGSGLLNMDGFLYTRGCKGKLTDDSLFSREFHQFEHNMFSLLLDTKAPFLICEVDGNWSLSQFLLKRPNESECQLPLSYKTLNKEVYSKGTQVGSCCITEFNELKLDIRFITSSYSTNNLTGNKDLYDFLIEHDLVYKNHNDLFPKYNGLLEEEQPKAINDSLIGLENINQKRKFTVL
ncbi:MAG: ankyrin repeat domain-containing protein [Proteobacteria bacterium]|nr:ankyrin repeat domain-containing protein [Pseudomonadota bacterium]